jgi:hypothetical protein
VQLYIFYCSTYVSIQSINNFGLVAVRYTCPYLWIFPTESHVVYSASNGNEHLWYLLWGNGGWSVGLTNSPPSCTNCQQILGSSTSFSPNGLYRDGFPFTLTFTYGLGLTSMLRAVQVRTNNCASDMFFRFSEIFLFQSSILSFYSTMCGG